MIEYRVCWSASSNISFHGQSDWTPWDDDEDTEDEVRDVLEGVGQRSNLPLGLEEALERSGFEWWVELQEALA